MTKKLSSLVEVLLGHVTLILILIPKFLKDGWEVHYIGDKHGIEHEQIEKSGLDVTFHSIATGKLRRYFSWQNMFDVFKVSFGILQSIAIIARFAHAFFKRWFVSVPPVIAAKTLGVPVLFMNLTYQWDLPIRLLINLQQRCIQHLNKLIV